MERSHVFEAVLVLVFVCLFGLLYFMIVSTPPAAEGWENAGNGSIDYMFVGSNDTLYAFSGNHIAAVRSDGSQAWALDMPGEWRVLNSWRIPLYSAGDGSYGHNLKNLPVFDERSGHLYLFVTQAYTKVSIDRTAGTPSLISLDMPSKLMAITPSGGIAWEYNFTVRCPDDIINGLTDPRFVRFDHAIAIKASVDRVYLFHDYCEDVLDKDGRLLFTLRNVSAPVSVDDQGRIFSVQTTRLDDATFFALPKNSSYVGEISREPDGTGHILPSSIVNAYNADGSLLWSRDIGESAVRAPMKSDVWQEYNTLPLDVNDTMYVPLNSGVAALDDDGNLKRVRHIPGGLFSLFQIMPADGQGNVYMEDLVFDFANDDSIVYAIAPDGSISADAWRFTRTGYRSRYHMADNPVPVAGKDGIVYAIREYPPITDGSFNDTMNTLQYGADTIKAIDVWSGRILWNFTVPYADRHAVILNESNVNVAARLSPESCGGYPPDVENKIRVYPGNGVTYISYDFTIFDYPVVYNESRCFYARGIYALDNNGRLLWETHPDGFVDRAAAGNGTIYYLTSNGRMGGTTVSIAAGVALAAIAYVFLRFFMLGTVARVRGRLDQNENRNRVLQYIADYPGLTVTDLVRGIGMNKGTIRYHLFILTLNHKVVTHREDDKYLRYFRNSGAYSEAERSLLSLLRRKPLCRTLHVLASKPGLSGSALARELGISPTAANRHIATLADRGIVEQVPCAGHGYGYVISEAYGERIQKLMERI